MSDGRYERELVRALRAVGYGAMRCPASGAASDAALPDLLAGQPAGTTPPTATVLAVELKVSGGNYVYVDAGEVAALQQFASGFGAWPLIGAKFKQSGTRTTYYLAPLENCHVTDSGNHRLKRETAEQAALLSVSPETGQKDAHLRVDSNSVSEQMRAALDAAVIEGWFDVE